MNYSYHQPISPRDLYKFHQFSPPLRPEQRQGDVWSVGGYKLYSAYLEDGWVFDKLLCFWQNHHRQKVAGGLDGGHTLAQSWASWPNSEPAFGRCSWKRFSASGSRAAHAKPRVINASRKTAIERAIFFGYICIAVPRAPTPTELLETPLTPSAPEKPPILTRCPVRFFMHINSCLCLVYFKTPRGLTTANWIK